MNNKVAIVGSYQTKYCDRDDTKSLTDMIFGCSSGLLKKYELYRDQVDHLIIGADDLLDGRSISSMVTVGPAGGHHKEWMKVAGDASFAFAYAYLGIAAGLSDLTMVVSWSKVSEVPYYNITNLTYDPFYHRPFLDELTSKAMQARAYVNKYNVTDKQAAVVTVKNRANGNKNPYAHLRSRVSMKTVLASAVLSSPIKTLDNSTLSEGACAILLASEAKAKEFEKPAWVKGISWDAHTYYTGDTDMSELHALRRAAKRAYQMAGIDNPAKTIDVAEISDISSYHELMEYEALGFCGKGDGGKFAEEGHTQLDGKLPVNPSGGMISSNPGCASGLARITETYLQISGDAGERQVKNARTALAHGIQGNACQTNCVVIISR